MKANKFVVTVDVIPDYAASNEGFLCYRPGDMHHLIDGEEVSVYEFYYAMARDGAKL